MTTNKQPVTHKRKLKLKKINWKSIQNDLKQIEWRDPTVIILCVLLAFITIGSGIGGVTGAFNSGVKVEIDAAFGGEATGYTGIVNEADVNENIVNDLEALLKADKRFKVLRTHEAGTTASVAERAEKINKDNPTVVISVHADGTPDTQVSGMRVYAEMPSAKNHDASLQLADAVKDAFTSDTWTPECGYLYYSPYEDTDTYELKFVDETDTSDYQLDSWELMNLCNVPVIITNQFNVTNESDTAQWANEDGYQAAAQKLYEALCTYNGFSLEG